MKNIRRSTRYYRTFITYFLSVRGSFTRTFWRFDLSRSILRVAIQQPRIIDISVFRFPLFSINHGVGLIMVFLAATKHKDLSRFLYDLSLRKGGNHIPILNYRQKGDVKRSHYSLWNNKFLSRNSQGLQIDGKLYV